jgi:hypothetical protein
VHEDEADVGMLRQRAEPGDEHQAAVAERRRDFATDPAWPAPKAPTAT